MLNLHRKEEWDTAPMATFRDKPKRPPIDWLTAAVYSAIMALAGLSCWAIKCGHGITLLGGWVFLGGVWLVWDANDRRFWRSFATFVVGIAAIIAGSVMMGAGS